MRLLSDCDRRVLGHKPSVADPNLAFDAQLTFGERIADRVATFGGSWTFIVLFVTGLVIWMISTRKWHSRATWAYAVAQVLRPAP